MLNHQTQFSDIPASQNNAKANSDFGSIHNVEGEFNEIYLSIYDDMPDEEHLNLFGSRKRKGKAKKGGKKWSKAEAKRFAKQAAGKVDSSEKHIKAIIGQDPSKIKEKRTKDFVEMVARAKENQKKLAAAWTDFQKARDAGWSDSGNRDKGRLNFNIIVQIEAISKNDWKKKHDWANESILDKAAQGLKTVNLAPIRAMFLLFIKANFCNVATMFKLASIRNAEQYARIRLKYKQLGGNRTTWDKAVDAGYKKKPLFAKKMTIDWNTVKFEGHYNVSSSEDADKTSEQLAQADQMSNLNETIKKAQDLVKAADTAIPPAKPADPNQKTLKISGGVMSGVAALSAGAGAVFGTSLGVTPATTAAGAAAGVAVGGILVGLLEIVNEMNIPLGDNETQPEVDPTPMTEAQKNAILQDAEKTAKEADNENKIAGMPKKTFWIVTGTILFVASVGTAIYFGSKKSK